MEELWGRLRGVGADRAGRCVRMFPFDVKAMFTELTKEAVLDAVRWLLQQNPGWAPVRGKRRRYPGSALVSKTPTGRFVARVSPRMKARAGEVRLPLPVVLQLVEFDLRESVMMCGEHLLWQVHGIPMGSFLSALLAGVTVSVAEHRFYQRLPPAVAERVEGVRFADDGVVAIVEWAGSVPAEAVFGWFVRGCYPAPLELEVEQHEGRFDLLESTVTTFPDGTGWVMHKSKNWDHFARTGRRRFRVWTGGDSWTGGRRGVLIGTLMRVEACCS